jgi:hypothetical protein
VGFGRLASPRNSLAAIGQQWLKSGAGDGNRKYRSDTHNPLKSGPYEISEALRVIIV